MVFTLPDVTPGSVIDYVASYDIPDALFVEPIVLRNRLPSERSEVIVIAQIDAPSYWGLAIRVGARVGLFNTGSGHVLLAFR